MLDVIIFFKYLIFIFVLSWKLILIFNSLVEFMGRDFKFFCYNLFIIVIVINLIFLYYIKINYYNLIIFLY